MNGLLFIRLLILTSAVVAQELSLFYDEDEEEEENETIVKLRTQKHPLFLNLRSRYNPNEEIVSIQPKENLDESYSYSIDYEEAKNAAQPIRMNPSDGGSLHHRTLENPSYESENSEFETNIISAQEKSLAEEDDDVDAVGFYYDGVWSLFVLVLINSTIFPIIYGVNAMKGKYDNLPKWVYQIVNFIEDVFLPFFGIQVVGQKKKGIRGKRQFKRKRDCEYLEEIFQMVCKSINCINRLSSELSCGSTSVLSRIQR
ncbi:hypothetical protein QYM36_009417 [Artemia franciscana]|uniref:Uncharacterized protein n=1 Tax=Artemia franciscana TaxID=6661 RepID=A0AA88L1W7_ARTSF|nr:hypothetical protein QYM36_009417 [Artemia franciscana]KAK2713531.1 hypothetical protein QYM36_009417 [Artemia franciscana]KAK2713532.1 hypothetical protein QYM36_009417 [Artemia franciscana]